MLPLPRAPGLQGACQLCGCRTAPGEERSPCMDRGGGSPRVRCRVGLSALICGAGTVWYVRGSGKSGGNVGRASDGAQGARSPTAGLSGAHEINTRPGCLLGRGQPPGSARKRVKSFQRSTDCHGSWKCVTRHFGRNPSRPEKDASGPDGVRRPPSHVRRDRAGLTRPAGTQDTAGPSGMWWAACRRLSKRGRPSAASLSSWVHGVWKSSIWACGVRHV